MRCFTIFKIKVCSFFDPANTLYYRLVLSVYTTYISGKLGQEGVGLGVRAIFNKPKKVRGQSSL